MAFASFSEFLAMGTHGPYVWSAYGISLGILVVAGITLRRRRAQVLADIRYRLRKEEASR